METRPLENAPDHDPSIEMVQEETRMDMLHRGVDYVGKKGVEGTEILRTAGEHGGEAVGNVVRGTFMTAWGLLRGVSGWAAKRPPKTNNNA